MPGPAPVIVPVSADNRYIVASPYDKDMHTIYLDEYDKHVIRVDYGAKRNRTGTHDCMDAGNVISTVSWTQVSGNTISVTGAGIENGSVIKATIYNVSPGFYTLVRADGIDGSSQRVIRTIRVYGRKQVLTLPTANLQERYTILFDYAALRNGTGATNWTDDGDYITTVGNTWAAGSGTAHGWTLKEDATQVQQDYTPGAIGEEITLLQTVNFSSGMIKTTRIKFLTGYR